MILRLNGKPDRRYREGREYVRLVKRNRLIGVALLGALAGMILTISFYRARNAPEALETSFVPEVEKVEAHETPCDFDPITYIRCKGESLEVENQDIMTMIRIGKCESHLNPDALHYNRNGTYDVGVFQINTVHKQTNMTDFVKNIDFAYKLFLDQGFGPWRSSRSCWN